MLEKIKNIKEELISLLEKTTNSEEVENLRIKYLSRKGIIPELFTKMKDVEIEVRKEAGKLLNTLKNDAYDLINDKKESFSYTEKVKIDLTLPGRKPEEGRFHPIYSIVEEVKGIFKKMGFSIASGPELETEYYIFDALNMPSWHPARKITDSLYVNKEKGLLMRTETSSVQIRTMEKSKPPFRIISPGRVYRNEKENATHGAMFWQCEGLYVDENVSFTQLKGTLLEFFKILYGEDTKVRFRPHFFPFTEPSAECDITCFKCKGKGCSICKGTGWLEVLGCGMVNPVVLKNVGIDTEKYTGFAFGMGLDRLAMSKYGIEDIRDIFDNDLRLLEQII